MRRFTTVGFILLALALAPGAAFAKGKPAHAGQPGGKPAHAGRPPNAGDGPGGSQRSPDGKKGGPHVLRELTHSGGGPPPWATAHGYRRKHGGGTDYAIPFGIGSGICKRDAVAAAIGAAGGGAVGAVVSEGDPRAILGGMLAGALLGTILSQTGDRIDRGCFGQALEHAPSHKAVSWRNPNNGTAYESVPMRIFETDDGRYCRDYATVVTAGGRERRERGTACRNADGSWH